MNTPHPLVGRTIAGRFRIKDLVGEGAMATVLSAEQDGEPRIVAVKVMRPELAVDPTFPKRFRREAKAASLLRHENVVNIVDFGADGDVHYIAMEMLGGRDLFDLLAHEKRLSERRAATIVMQVCSALALAHGQGIIHRDLKPENIWMLRESDVAQDDRVKVLDFGIAKLLEGDAPSSSGHEGAPSSNLLTKAGTVVGTPEYMSPEQCKAEPVGPRSDVYACGVLLYQLVAGKPPFMGGSPIEVTVMQVHEPPEPPSKLRPGLNAELERIILSCLEKAPEARMKSAADLRDALAAILPKLSTEAPGSAESMAFAIAPTAVSPMVSEEPTVERGPPPASPFERTLASEGVPPKSEPKPALADVNPLEATILDPSLALPQPVARVDRQAPTRRGSAMSSANTIVWIVLGLVVAIAIVAMVLMR